MDWFLVVGDFFVNFFNSIIGWVSDVIGTFINELVAYIGSGLIAFGLSLELPDEVFLVFNEITLGLGYILPIKELLPIVNFWVVFYISKLIFALYKMIAGLLIKRVSISGLNK